MIRRCARQTLLVTMLLLVTLSIANLPIAPSSHAQLLPVVGVWSNTYASSNITDTTLTAGNTVRIEINVTGAPSFNAYEFYLFYDPAFLEATSTDFRTGTLCGSPSLVSEELIPLGTVRLAVVNLGVVPCTSGDGVLAHIDFRVRAIGVSPLTLAAGTTNAESQTWTRLALGLVPIDIETSDGYFKNEPTKIGPTAVFDFSPSSPKSGDTITFNATQSFDLDSQNATFNGIVQYRWDYGDGRFDNTNESVVRHGFFAGASELFGNFSVRLTVVDGDSFLGMRTRLVNIAQADLHDLEVFSLAVSPDRPTPGQLVEVTVLVRNRGTFSETFNLTVTYSPPPTIIGQNTGEVLSVQERTRTYRFPLDTTGITGFITIRAEVTLPEDNVPGNNVKLFPVNISASRSEISLFIVGGVVGIAGAIVAVGVLLSRRRRARQTE